jgi:hypothetical protein
LDSSSEKIFCLYVQYGDTAVAGKFPRDIYVNLQPVDLAASIGAITWRLIAAVALIAFRRPLNSLIGVMDERMHKFSVGVLSVELAKASQVKPQSLESEIRELDAGLILAKS